MAKVSNNGECLWQWRKSLTMANVLGALKRLNLTMEIVSNHARCLPIIHNVSWFCPFSRFCPISHPLREFVFWCLLTYLCMDQLTLCMIGIGYPTDVDRSWSCRMSLEWGVSLMVWHAPCQRIIKLPFMVPMMDVSTMELRCNLYNDVS